MQQQKRNNELVYGEEEYKKGQINGKREIERLDFDNKKRSRLLTS